MNFSLNMLMIFEELNLNDMKDMRGIILEEYSLVVMVVCGFIVVFLFIGNFLLCIVILKRWLMLIKFYNVLIFNLVVIDMLIGEICFILFL